MAHCTLFLSDEGLSLYRRERKQWTCTDQFTDSPDDLARFADFLEKHRRTRFQLLADLSSEESVLESIPKASGKDRQALIERKLEQHFPATSLRTASTLKNGKEPVAREKLRLSAFSRHQDFTPWLAAIATQKTLLSGIFSTRQVLGALLPESTGTPLTCLLFIQKRQVLSQHLLINGELYFSRSIVSTTDDIPLEDEAVKLQQYLLNQRLIERAQTLPILVLCDTPRQFRHTDSLRFEQLKADKEIALLFLEALDKQAPKTQFAPADLLRPARLATTRHVAFAIVLLCAAISLPLTGRNILETEQLRQAATEGEAKIRQLEQQSGALRWPAAESPTSSQLRERVQQYKELQQKQRDPQVAFSKLSQVLDRHPAIHLEKLDWQSGDGQETLLVEGRVSAEATGAQAIFDDFQAALAVDRNKLTLLRQTLFDDSNKHSLSGNSTQQAPQTPRNFIIEIKDKP